MLEFISEYFSINNPEVEWPIYLYGAFQILLLVSSVTFLSLFIWSLVLFIREKRIDSTSRRFLPRLLGFLFAMLLCVAGLTLAIQGPIWF